MTLPAQNVLLVYDRATRSLKRIIILDFLHQEDFPEWHTPENGEAMFKVPLSTYQLWATDQFDHLQRRAERYVQQNAP